MKSANAFVVLHTFHDMTDAQGIFLTLDEAKKAAMTAVKNSGYGFGNKATVEMHTIGVLSAGKEVGSCEIPYSNRDKKEPVWKDI